MSTDYFNRQIEIFALSIFLGIIQAFRHLSDIPIRIGQNMFQHFRPLALGRMLILTAFGLLLGFLSGFLIVWIIIHAYVQ